MAFVFSPKSTDRLYTCHPSIRTVATRALELTAVDFTIVSGWRNEEAQSRLVEIGVSKTPWPQSKHNHMENGIPWSRAIDFAPIVGGRIYWEDTHIFAVVAGAFFAAAIEHGVKIRWGGDWNMNGRTTDQSFMDWGHVELAP